MTTLNQKLQQLLTIQDEAECARSFEAFCKDHFEDLPLPGENKLFDKAMWTASQFLSLSQSDQAIVTKVTRRLETNLNQNPVVAGANQAAAKLVFSIKELVGQTKESAVNAWQEMLGSYSWSQMEPAGATRGVGTRLVSLGTFQQNIDDVQIQVNLGWLVDQDNLRLLLQAKDKDENAIPEVEIKIFESDRGVVFARKTNQDGAMVAPSVKVGPGQYQIQVFYDDKVLETPFFRV